jgi:hypothetical protein
MDEVARKEKEKRNQLTVCRSLNNIFTRYKDIEDPVLRSMLLLDKFLIGLDVLEGFIMNMEMHQDVRMEAEKVCRMIRKATNHLSQVVTTSTYSPDHPSLGSKIMKSAQQDFVQLSEEKKINLA